MFFGKAGPVGIGLPDEHLADFGQFGAPKVNLVLDPLNPLQHPAPEIGGDPVDKLGLRQQRRIGAAGDVQQEQPGMVRFRVARVFAGIDHRQGDFRLCQHQMCHPFRIQPDPHHPGGRDGTAGDHLFKTRHHRRAQIFIGERGGLPPDLPFLFHHLLEVAQHRIGITAPLALQAKKETRTCDPAFQNAGGNIVHRQRHPRHGQTDQNRAKLFQAGFIHASPRPPFTRSGCTGAVHPARGEAACGVVRASTHPTGRAT